jgi:hypothetical protein
MRAKWRSCLWTGGGGLLAPWQHPWLQQLLQLQASQASTAAAAVV